MSDTFYYILREVYATYWVYLRRYPKAARKRRNRTKWYNRFGGGVMELFGKSTTEYCTPVVPKKYNEPIQLRIPYSENL